jgi:hypothetical protein
MEGSHIDIRSNKDLLVLATLEMIGSLIVTIGMQFGYKTRADTKSAGLFIAKTLTFRVTGSHLNWGVTLGVIKKAYGD